MKQLFLFIIIATLCACNAEPPPTPRATFASIETPQPKRAANVGQTAHGVTAYYLDSDASFSLYFAQCVTLAYDGKVIHLDCEVYQSAPGVFVADFGNGEFCKVNTMTGTTTIYKNGVNRVYRKGQTP